MDNFFAGSELVELAIQIEKNGYDFYSTLAAASRDPLIANLFTFLAREEERHISAFKKVCERVEGCGKPETSADEYVAYMNALASEHVFTQKDRGVELARLIKSDAEALDRAIGFEKDSIVFYEGMLAMVPPGERPVVESLIAQEKNHLLKLVALKKTKTVP